MEKVLVTSKRYNTKKILPILPISFITAIIVFIAVYSFDFMESVEYYNSWSESAKEEYGSSIIYALKWTFGLGEPHYFIIGAILAVTIIVVGILYFCSKKTELTVTDKRVYGKTIFGKYIDLPLDKISAVGFDWPKAISVATSSGNITFAGISNREEIYECINKLLIERQDKAKIEEKTKQEIHQVSNADELKKYKNLFDEGIITQEEFEAKKKQILGI